MTGVRLEDSAGLGEFVTEFTCAVPAIGPAFEPVCVCMGGLIMSKEGR